MISVCFAVAFQRFTYLERLSGHDRFRRCSTQRNRFVSCRRSTSTFTAVDSVLISCCADVWRVVRLAVACVRGLSDRSIAFARAMRPHAVSVGSHGRYEMHSARLRIRSCAHSIVFQCRAMQIRWRAAIFHSISTPQRCTSRACVTAVWRRVSIRFAVRSTEFTAHVTE